MRGERQKTACSSAFTSWLMLKTKVFALRENAVLSHECTYFPAFSAFAASPFRWYFTCTLKSVGLRSLQIWLYLRFHLL